MGSKHNPNGRCWRGIVVVVDGDALYAVAADQIIGILRQSHRERFRAFNSSVVNGRNR